MKFNVLSIAAVAMLSGVANFAYAENSDARSSVSGNWYIGGDASFSLNKVGEDGNQASFKPVTVGARIGRYLQDGVALEVFGRKGIVSDEDLGIDMKMISNFGVLGRFESPEKEGMKIHLLLGYAATELEIRRTATSLPDREIFHGGVLGAGMEFRLGKGSPYFLDIQGMRQYSQDDLSIDSASVGVRYEF